MFMPKIDQMPDYQAQLGRTGHSLSHDLSFTSTCGHLLPVFHDFLNAGETVTLGFDFNLRTQPLEAAAMSKIITHTEYFFVPIQLLYQGFSDWYYGTREQFSSQFLTNDELGAFSLPKVNLATLFTALNGLKNNLYAGNNNKTVYAGESFARSAFRLFEMFGFRADAIATGVPGSDSSLGSVFPYQVLAYNCIYQNYYRLDNRELFNPAAFNVDRYYSTGIIDADKLKIYCCTRLRPMDSDYFTDIKQSPIVDVLNLNNKTSLDAVSSFLSPSGKLSSGSVNSIPFNSSSSDPSSNIQTQFGFKTTSRSVTTGVNSLYKDVNGVVSAVNSPAVLDSGALVDSVQHENMYHSHDFNYTYVNGVDIGTANIRAMFASEKLWSVTGRAKKNYDDQTLAHFGFKVPHDPKHSISCFGHDTSEIAIGEVISTSNTSTSTGGSPLGEIAGKGYGRQSNTRHKFTAPCHGVVMAIFSVVPQVFYENTFLKANQFSTREDLYTPEYDHLGMQPLFDYETRDTGGASIIVGWQYRYEQWKRRYNRCTSAFKSFYVAQEGPLSSWIHTAQPYAPLTVNSGYQPNTYSYYYYLVPVQAMNDLMLYQYSTQWSSAYESKPSSIYEGDPFIVNSHIDCVKVSTMSDYSLPRLDA